MSIALIFGCSAGALLVVAGARWGGLVASGFTQMSPPQKRKKQEQRSIPRKPVSTRISAAYVPEEDWLAEETPVIRDYIEKEIESRTLSSLQELHKERQDTPDS